MRTFLACLAVAALLVVVHPWAARAGDGTSVEERLANVEGRLTKVEESIGFVREFLFHARLDANEMAAIATLRNVTSAQAQFEAAGVADEDRDGVGEYGGFAELTGSVPGRQASRLNPPVLAPAFVPLNANGEATRNGYHYRIFLPTRDGSALAEPPTGFAKGGGHDIDTSEVAWCCYAWPVKQGLSGMRTFFINQEGDVLAAESAAYSGTGAGPKPDAAFKAARKITGPTAAGTKGADGNTWQPVQ